MSQVPAGASAPETVVEAVLDYLKERFGAIFMGGFETFQNKLESPSGSLSLRTSPMRGKHLRTARSCSDL